MSSWRPALRIARRTVLRSPGRSLLIALLVAVPVMGATTADIVARTFSAADRDAQRQIGSADAEIFAGTKGGPTIADVRASLPAGSRIAPAPHFLRNIGLRDGKGFLDAELFVADVGEPLHRHEAKLESGRAPRRANEALVSASVAETLDLIGDDGKLRGGASATLANGQAIIITGLVSQRFCLSCDRVVTGEGSIAARAAVAGLDDESASPQRYLIDLPDGVVAADVNALHRRGIILKAREDILRPHPGRTLNSVSADSLRAAALAAIILGLGLLEVVLLAGTAFAVGARRQMREIGLVAASGASPRDVKRIVLAQGIVLGALGAAIGIAAGVVLGLAGRPWWENLFDEAVVQWAYGPWEIIGAGLVGLFSGFAAAVVPARGAARMRPVDALAQRFRVARLAARRTTFIGAGLVAGGVLLGLMGDRMLADDFARYERMLESVQRLGTFVQAPSTSGPITLVVGGATLAVLGLVLLAPTFISSLARLGGHLPLSGRLAARDAARHRYRTGPAAGAITVVVAGSIVLAFLSAGVSRGEEQSRPPGLPPDVLRVEREQGGRIEAMNDVAQRAAAELPGSRLHVLQTATIDDGELGLLENLGRCPAADKANGGCSRQIGDGHLAVATSDGLADTVSAGRLDSAARSALAQGKVVVFNELLLDKAGRVRIEDDPGVGLEEDPPTIRLPGHFVDRGKAYIAMPSGLIAPSVVRANGWKTQTRDVLVRFPASTNQSSIDRALAAADNSDAIAYVDRRYTRDDGALLLAVALITGLVTLLGVAISVALSAAEGRADLATLAAVGAPPRRRRTLVAAQALVIGGLGTALGLALGTFVAFTARATTGATTFVVPWGNVLATGIAVPLLAALVAALCTRSRLPMVRRAE